MKADDIILKVAIMHILDTISDHIVLSEKVLEITPDMNDFLCAHIEKVTESDDCRKHCIFDEVSPMMPLISGASDENFVRTSQEMAIKLFDLMKTGDIPAADIFIVVFACAGIDYMALLKMNYKSSFTHKTEGEEIRMVTAHELLPPATSKLTEAFAVNLTNGEIELCEKAYEIDGTKTNYLSSLYLQCHTPLSQKTKLDIVERAASSVAKKHYGDEAPKERMEMKRVLCEELAKPEGMAVAQMPELIFPDSPSMQEEFVEKLKDARMETETIEAKNPATVKKFQTQRLVTDSGIEIKIPMEEYENANKVEIITNPDGSRNVIIKNISKITAK